MRSAFVFLLLGMASTALGEGCPPDEDILPCICTEDDIDVDVTLTCADEDTTPEILQKVLGAFDPQKTMAVELDGLTLGNLPSTFFKSFNVQRLEIIHCELDGLASDGGKVLTGLENTLDTLIISSSITDADPEFRLELSHMKRLRELELSYNWLSELGDDWFQNGPATLGTLLISNNNIEKIGQRAFATLENLVYFSLDGNRFGPVSRSMFPNPASKLQELELDNNALTSIPEDMFSGMPSLEKVSLRTNGLRKMPKETFQPVWEQLDTLDMRGNQLECDSHIEWMFQEKSLVSVFGKCFSPADKKGVELHDLIKGKVLLH